jgi:putative flippase GtrA
MLSVDWDCRFNMNEQNLEQNQPSERASIPTPEEVSAPTVEAKKFSLLQKDIIISASIGLLCALLILPIAQNLALKISWALSLIVILPILSVLGMWLTYLIAQKIKIIYQIAKFVLVGILNTFVDWGVLNLLMFLTSITSGVYYTVFKGISFLFATTNSYFWNKFWTFSKPRIDADVKTQINADNKMQKSAPKEFLRFLVVSAIGFLLNVSTATLIVNVWGSQFGIGDALWANIGAFCGTLTGLTWNFLGYKLIVFKS